MAWTTTTALASVDLVILLLIGVAGYFARRRRVFAVSDSGSNAARLLIAGLLFAVAAHFVDLTLLLGSGRIQTSLADGPPAWYLLLRWLLLGATATLLCLGFLHTTRLVHHYRESLKTSENRYRRIVEDQTELIVRWKPGGIRTWVNDAYCDFFGQPREKLIGTSFFPLIAEEDRERIQAQIASLSPASPSRTGEHLVLQADGSRGWQEWTDRAIFDTSGSIIEIQSVGRDITDRKVAELTLAERENQFRSLVENTADWVWQMNLAGEHTYSNGRVQSILGYSEAEFLTFTLDELTHPDDLKTVRARLPQLIESGEGWRNWLIRFRHRNGTYRYLDSSASPLFDAEGNLASFLGMDRDVTFQTLTAVASNDLMRAEIDKPLLIEVMGRFADYFGVDTMTCWWFTPERDEVRSSLHWKRPGTEVESRVSFQVSQLPWTARQALEGKVVTISDLDEMPAEAEQDRRVFEQMGLRSGLIVPITLGDTDSPVANGSVGISSGPHNWLEREITELQFLFRLIATAEARLYSEAEVQAAERFQSLLSGISKDLIEVRPESIDARIDNSLEQVARYYSLDRISLWSFDEGRRNLRCINNYTRTEMSSRFDPEFPVDRIPWMTSKALAGEALRIDRIEDIPEAQSTDQETLVRFGVKSILSIPLLVENQPLGIGMFSTLTEPRRWKGAIEAELTLLAMVLINAYVRSRATTTIQQREADLSRSEALAHVGSYSFYPGSKPGDRTPAGRAIFSREMAALFDCSQDEASYDLYVSRLHSQDRERVIDATRYMLESGGSMHQQFRIVRPSGEVVHLEDHSEVLRDRVSGTLRVFGSVQDVTEQVIRERSLKGALSQIETLKDRLEEENLELRDEIKSVQKFGHIVGDSPALRRCLNLVSNVATTDATVLVLGETGTGKELIAHTIHDLSPRRNRRMISVNCAALPAELIESELFGHEKGAFTGASSMRKGRFELANGSTLFLDEIGELPLALQSKLLRAIQEGEIERLGGSDTLKVDVRLIAATNRNLKACVESGEFRADLFYRINTFPIEVPSLNERREDIPLLAEHLVRKLAPGLDREITSISAGMIRYLKEREWPGNVRELEGFIERALITNNGAVLTYSPGTEAIDAGHPPQSAEGDSTLRAIERSHIISVLDRTDWTITGNKGAARILGVPPSTLRSRMKKLGINRPE